MADMRELRIAPTPPVRGVDPIQPEIYAHRGASGGHDGHAAERSSGAAAVTDGSLQPAYAQYVIDPHTHDVIVRIRDGKTDQVIKELPGPEVEAMHKTMRDYADMLARRKVATQSANKGDA